jgi:hypothetical protein
MISTEHLADSLGALVYKDGEQYYVGIHPFVSCNPYLEQAAKDISTREDSLSKELAEALHVVRAHLDHIICRPDEDPKFIAEIAIKGANEALDAYYS